MDKNTLIEITKLIDKTMNDISGRQLVSVSEITDVLLDIRLMLIIDQESTPSYENQNLG